MRDTESPRVAANKRVRSAIYPTDALRKVFTHPTGCFAINRDFIYLYISENPSLLLPRYRTD